ncbi:MAG: SDR family oxidoreductase [Candidatus Lambdaproteobacteria bacterium]|nr:SDR family oxidoreductase [Candidatus Lambdaproteobacteria bacterium]
MEKAHVFRLDGKVAIVTGSSRGIGRAIADALADAGAKVVISARNAGPCEEVVDGIKARGGDAIAVPCHAGRQEALQNLLDKSLAAYGKLDVLVCNAGVNPYYGSLEDLSDDVFEKILRTNILGTHWLCRMALPHIAAQGGGAAILVGSYSGLRGSEHIAAYGVSKAGVISLTKSLAMEWGRKNIRVNCLIPGLIKTEFAKALWDNQDIYDTTISALALKRLGTAEDCAGAAVFLAAPASSYLTGTSIIIDGGLTITSKT